MYLHFFEFICLLYISRLAIAQNCSEEYSNTTTSSCGIPEKCGLPKVSAKGRKTRICGANGTFTDATNCEYEFNITFSNSGDIVNVSVGAKAIFNCEQRQNYSLKPENETIENVLHSHHGRKVFCNWTKDNGTEEISNNSTDSTQTTSYVILNVLSFPTFDKKSVSILDSDSKSEMFLKISFWARSDKAITRSDLTVLHNDNETDDYYFKPGEISQNILFHYENVDAENFGNYTVQVEFCNSDRKNIYANFAYHGNTLHTGYIISIALGSVLLIVLIVFVVLFVVYRSKWRKDASDASKNSTSTLAMKHSNDGPARAQNNYHPPKPDQAPYRPPVPQSSQQYHNHDAQFDTDDDEFEPDDYEPMSPSERPPMPLPPATRGNPHQQQPQQQQRLPRSPLPSVPPTRTLPRDLPPARVVSPPQSRGPPPRRAVASPPPRSRAAPTPPYVNNRRPHKPYEYAGQEYEESDFQQEDYEVPVSKYR